MRKARPDRPIASNVRIPLNVKIPRDRDNRFARFTEQMSKEITN